MTEPRKYSHSDMGFGDVQTDEENPQDLNQPVSPVAPVIPTIAPPSLPKAAVPTAPPLPRPPKSENAADIMPPLPPTPSIVQNPVNQENAKVLGEYGLGAAALTTLLASLPFIYRKVAGENPPPATGPELTINPSAPTEPVVEKPVQTIRSRSFSPAEQYVAENINKQYPFTFEEAKKGLGLEGVKVTSPQEAEIVANQYAKQLQAQAAASQPAAAPAAEIPTVVPTEAAAPAAAPAEAPKAAVPPKEPAKKTGRPAASTLEPTTFRADLGPGDNWLYNTAGPDRRRAILAEFNEGKPAKDYKTAQEIYKKYQEKYPKDMFGPVLPIEEAKSRGIKPPEPYGKLGKVAKVGGVAGLALTAAELANAAEKAKKGEAGPLRENLFNLLGMIPGLGTAFTAGTFSGGLNEGEEAELARRRQMAPAITGR